MRQNLKFSTTMLLSLVLVGAVFATAFVPRNAVAEEASNFCGPMDITIALDDTGSMFGAIDNIIAALPDIIDQAKAASGPDGLPDTADDDLRLGYITFKDDVTVHHKLTDNLAAVEASIAAAFASGGGGLPEASDEAKNTAVNNLSARPGQTGDFDEPWRAGAVNILILITDAPPGGFNDIMDLEDVDRMHDVAVTAASLGIRVSDVFVPTAGDYAGQAAILEDDAITSGGVFITTAADGTGTADAIMAIIETCGTAVQPVDIDIKPGSDPNSINTNNKGVIPVALLGSATFDVSEVDETSLAFGPSGASPVTVATEDVNHDGFDDLVMHFKTQDTGISPGDTEACLTGELTDGTMFEGCDSVNTVPPS